MKIDLKDISSGVMTTQVIQKIVKQLTEEQNGEKTDGLTIIDNGIERVIPVSNKTDTLILIEILGHVKNIDANVEKLLNKTN